MPLTTRELWTAIQAAQATNQQLVEIPDVGRDNLARLFAYLDFNTGAEIGTERGLYAETLCQANPFLRLHCVDPYRAYRGYREHTSQSKLHAFYMEARKRLAPYPVTFHRDFGTEVAPGFYSQSLDFVYIDGNHSLLHVIQDLHSWVPKVRPGGIVAGHDYIRRRDPAYAMHVVQATHAYCDAYNIRPLLILGAKEVKSGAVRDRPRSWLFIKK